MKFLILAAGKGERLMPLTRNTPKSLLELGHGLTLLETQLEALRATEIRDVVLLTGYRSEQIEAKIRCYTDFRFQIVYNPFFDRSNNLISAWMAMPHVGDDFVLVNGDDIFRTEVVERLMISPHEVTMMVSRKREYDDDDMKVVTELDRVLQVSKSIDPEQANGESIGMMRFRGNGARWFAEELEHMVRDPHNMQLFYLEALQRIMRAGLPVHWAECEPEEWSEIDFHPDLALLRDQLTERLLLPDAVLSPSS